MKTAMVTLCASLATFLPVASSSAASTITPHSASCVTPLLVSLAPQDAHPNFDRGFLKIGLLVELENGKKILGFNEYIGSGHESIAKQIEAKVAPIRRYLWGGDVLLRRDSANKNGGFVIAKINNRSGFLARLSGEANVDNRLENLQAFFQEKRIPSITPTTVITPFGPTTPAFSPKLAGTSSHDVINVLTFVDGTVQALRRREEKGIFQFAKSDVLKATLRDELPRFRTIVTLIGLSRLKGVDSETPLRLLGSVSTGSALSNSDMVLLETSFHRLSNVILDLVASGNTSEVTLFTEFK